MSKYHLTVQHDDDVGNPCEENDGQWQIYSFNNRHVHFKHPEELQDEETGELKADIKAKLESGLAFFLSYYEHGLCMWSLAGHGPQCQWDSVSKAGIAIWEEPEENIGAKDYDGRANDCKNALEEFTEWCNGNCYCFTITDKKGKKISEGNFLIGSDQLEDAIREELPKDATKQNTEIDDKYGTLSLHNIFPDKTPA